MGLRPLNDARWLEVDENRAAEHELKGQHRRDAYEVVVAYTLEDSEELLATANPTSKDFIRVLRSAPRGMIIQSSPRVGWSRKTCA
jgi:hypothetical protein